MVLITGSYLTHGLGEVDGMGPLGSCLVARRNENWSAMLDLPELISDAPDQTGCTMMTGPNGPDSLLALTKPYNPISPQEGRSYLEGAMKLLIKFD